MLRAAKALAPTTLIGIEKVRGADNVDRRSLSHFLVSKNKGVQNALPICRVLTRDQPDDVRLQQFPRKRP